MWACHAVQAVTALALHSPNILAAPIAVVGDKQVKGIVPGGLDRPPRTV